MNWQLLTPGVDQCGQLTRDRGMSLEIAESPVQLEVGDLSMFSAL